MFKESLIIIPVIDISIIVLAITPFLVFVGSSILSAVLLVTNCF